MTNNPTAEKQFYKKLTKLIETGVVKFDAEPREVIAWFEKMWQQYAQQSPVTDEQIKDKAYEISINELKSPAHLDHSTMMLRLIEIAKWLRDLQPKTDDWVSVDDRLPTEQDGNEKGEILVSTDVGSTILLSWKYAGQKSAGEFTFPFWRLAPQPPNPKNR